MATRILFLCVATFWGIMNVLLWRAEFGRGRETLSDVSLATVVDRLLNAPDPSTLQIARHGTTLGTLRWIPTLEETRPTDSEDRSLVPEGMVDATGYNLDLDLNLITGPAGPLSRTRVLAHLDLDTNHVWQSLSIRLFQRPATWELSTRAGDDSVRVRFEEGKNSWDQSFNQRDLGRLTETLGPYAALLPAQLMSNLGHFNPAHMGQELTWSARNDWLKIGRSRVRTYRIQFTVLQRYDLVAHLSRAGEILQITLPDGVVLSNESLPFFSRN